MDITQRIWIVLFWGFLTIERHLIVKAAELNQYVHSKGISISKFMSKDTLLWKASSAFVSTESKRLWICSRLRWIQFDQPRPPERSLMTPWPIGSNIQSGFKTTGSDNAATPVRT